MALPVENYHREKIYNKVSDTLQKHSYQCKNCGRKEVIRFDMDRRLCSHCGHYIYKSDELERQYKFKENLMKEIRRK